MSAAKYQLSVQKNGRLNISLTSGAPVFQDVYAMVWIEGEEEPRALEFDWRGSRREAVHDRLGEGQGMVFEGKDGQILIATYPTQPFFTVQAGFYNRGKKPVRVKMLMPWCTGGAENSGLTLGGDAAQTIFLGNGRTFEGRIMPARTLGQAMTDFNVAAVHPVTGRSLIAGFLTSEKARTQLRIERTETALPELSDVFRAECVYEPGVEVKPGESLLSERLYVAVAETNPLEGLERYGHAMAAVTKVRREPAFIPHGWDSWSTKYRTNIDEQSMRVALEFMDKNLKRYGWTHFAIDDGWQNTRGDWEAHPDRFPKGMKAFADEVHSHGMTFGLWVDPFRVDLDSEVAKAHPEWLRKATADGEGLVGENERIIDITAPGAYEHVRDLFKKIGPGWGVDALMEADFVYLLLLADSYYDTSLTRIEIYRKGLQAIREGFGNDRFMMSMPPLPITGVYADGMRLGQDCAPIWRQQEGAWPWGCVETLSNAAKRYYFAPYMWMPDQDCAFFGHMSTRIRWQVGGAPPLTPQQSTAWLTGAALTGGVIKIGDNFTDLTPEETSVLQRITPVAQRPARPVDLFANDNPRVWSLPMKSDAGEWDILGLFNWDETADQSIAVDLVTLGLAPGQYYTVYNFWGDVYHGTVKDRLEIKVPAGSVQLLGLRPFENRPMFLAHDRHFAQGALDMKALRWDASTRTLSGTLQAVADTEYGLRFLVPPPFVAKGATSSVGALPLEMDGQVVKVRLRSGKGGAIGWEVRF
ncbi:MAG: alpha-galactosidase [FCB group bacterium]|nr:alpha-galactosidase [FCB group bacterium]